MFSFDSFSDISSSRPLPECINNNRCRQIEGTIFQIHSNTAHSCSTASSPYISRPLSLVHPAVLSASLPISYISSSSLRPVILAAIYGSLFSPVLMSLNLPSPLNSLYLFFLFHSASKLSLPLPPKLFLQPCCSAVLYVGFNLCVFNNPCAIRGQQLKAQTRNIPRGNTVGISYAASQQFHWMVFSRKLLQLWKQDSPHFNGFTRFR